MPITMMAKSLDPRTAGLAELGWGGHASAGEAIRLMQQFTDVEVSAQGCFRLNRLARRGEWQAVLDAGGTAAIMDAMKAHPSSAELQEEGLHALGYLLDVGGDAVLEEVRGADGAELLQAAQNQWPEKKFFQYFCSAAVGKLLCAPTAPQASEARRQEAQPEPEPELAPEEDLSLPYSFAPGGGGGGTRRLLPPVHI